MTHSVDDSNERRGLQLSALCDGEATAAEAQASFEAWRDDPALRARWHSYQWIGDVMRSDDLASDAGHDQAFLLALRERLAQEPVVLAPSRPQPAIPAIEPAQVPVVAAAGGAAVAAGAAAGGRRQRWGAPMAMAAGVMVTGALVVMSSSAPQAPTASATLASVAPTSAAVPVQAAFAGGPGNAASAVQGGVLVGDMLRNPDLDRYLNAHRQYVQTSTLAMPGGVRQVAVTPDGR